MINIVCLMCGFTLRVEGDSNELDFLVGKNSSYWPSNYSCVKCGKQSQGFYPEEVSSAAASKLSVVDVTPQEAFAALNGLGLPEERSCHLSDVSEMISKIGVKRLVGANIPGTARCVIDCIELMDGTKVYLGPSVEGATVYRVTRPLSYVEKLEEGHG